MPVPLLTLIDVDTDLLPELPNVLGKVVVIPVLVLPVPYEF